MIDQESDWTAIEEKLAESSLAISQSSLSLEAADLHQQGYKGKALQAELEIFNSTLYPPADEAFLLQLLAQYPGNEEQKQREEQMADSIDAALEALDKKALFNCVPLLAKLTPIELALKKDQIKLAFGKSLNSNDFAAAIHAEKEKIKRAQGQNKPDIALVAYNWSCSYRELCGYDDDCQVWRMYNDSYWEEQAKRSSLLDQYAVVALQEAHISVNSEQVLNAFQRLAAAYCKRDFRQPHNKVNFANGTLHIDTGQLMQFDREDNFIYCLPYSYNPHGKHPHIDVFLCETIPDIHARQAFIGHLGLALLRDTSIHNFLLALGPPRAGKSTLAALANAICGASDPWRFAGPSLFSRETEGKRSRAIWSKYRIVCVDELPSEALRDEEILKIMSAHGGVEQRAIGKDERENNRWLPKLFMSTNNTPHYKDISGAIKQRAIIITCPHHRPESQQDKTLFTKKLLPEIEAFAATCIQLALILLKRGYYPRSAEMKRLVDKIAVAGNSLKAFISDDCILDPKVKVSIKAFFNAYRQYCIENDDKNMGQSKMTAALEDMHIGVERKKIRDPETDRIVWGLVGIRLRPKNERLEENEAPYQTDELLVSHTESTPVDIVDVPLTSHVNGVKHLKKPVEDPLLTLLTQNDRKVSEKDTSPVRNKEQKQGEKPLKVGGYPLEQNNSKNASTTSTRPLNDHEMGSHGLILQINSSPTTSTRVSRDL